MRFVHNLFKPSLLASALLLICQLLLLQSAIAQPD